MAMMIASAGSACAGWHTPGKAPDFTAAQCGPYPKNYKTLVTAALHERARDTASLQIKFGSPPVPGASCSSSTGDWTPAWRVIVLMNARNAFGGYTGPHRVIVQIFQGKVVDTLEVTD